MRILLPTECALCKDGWKVFQTKEGPVHIDILGDHKDYGYEFPCPTAELPEYLREENEP